MGALELVGSEKKHMTGRKRNFSEIRVTDDDVRANGDYEHVQERLGTERWRRDVMTKTERGGARCGVWGTSSACTV